MSPRAVRHVVFVTQVVDQTNPTLGFVTGWIRALAAQADRVTAIGNEVRGRVDLGSNVEVVSLGKEREAGRLRRGAALERVVWDAGRAPGTVLLAHMCPIYLDLSAPVAWIRRTPTMLWFAHPEVTPALKVAEPLTDAILTSLPGAYPRPGPKVHVIGQAIDTEALTFDEGTGRHGGVLRLVALGRTSPSKGFDRVIRGVANARGRGIDVRLRIVGPSTTDAERSHLVELSRLIERESLEDVVGLEPGVDPAGIAEVLRDADGLVNAMVAGSGDKVVFEAMAIGRVPIVSNPAFRELLQDLPLPVMFDRDDEQALADRIAGLAAAPAEVVDRTRRELRRRVERGHSLTGWAERVLSIAAQLR